MRPVVLVLAAALASGFTGGQASTAPRAAGATRGATGQATAAAGTPRPAAPDPTGAAIASAAVPTSSGAAGTSRPTALATTAAGAASPVASGTTAAGVTRYVTAWTSIRTAAGDDGTVEVTVGPRYKVVTTGATAVDDGVGWLRVTWSSPARHGTGWIRTGATSTTRPAGGDASARVNALSATLAAYLADYGSRVGVEVLDVTHSVVYTADAAGTFITASSVKVPIMLAVMARAERAHRSLTSTEQRLLTSMIERSDNAAASELYAEIGGRTGLAAWARRFGITGLAPEGAGPSWGYTTIHPATMVTILERLRAGRLVSSSHRADALDLMRHVIPSQRFGVGTGSPAGATVALKNGWVVGPDGRWAVNSSGIVTADGVTWVISVYTRGNASFSAGSAIVTHVAKVIGVALT
ncbi:MAG TPA: serine hydrolase [Acidimicrobiales bacterium]|nr:serine hydrolase [Acidimicrobiales bacterium]